MAPLPPPPTKKQRDAAIAEAERNQATEEIARLATEQAIRGIQPYDPVVVRGPVQLPVESGGGIGYIIEENEKRGQYYNDSDIAPRLKPYSRPK